MSTIRPERRIDLEAFTVVRDAEPNAARSVGEAHAYRTRSGMLDGVRDGLVQDAGGSCLQLLREWPLDAPYLEVELETGAPQGIFRVLPERDREGTAD